MVPGYQASRMASASSDSALRSSGRPLRSTTATCLPCFLRAFRSSVCSLGRLMDVREAASPVQLQGSPSTRTTLFEALVTGVTSFMASSIPAGTASTSPAARQEPRRSSRVFAMGPRTATFSPFLRGRMPLFLRRTMLSAASLRAKALFSAVRVRAFSRSGSQYL